MIFQSQLAPISAQFRLAVRDHYIIMTRRSVHKCKGILRMCRIRRPKMPSLQITFQTWKVMHTVTAEFLRRMDGCTTNTHKSLNQSSICMYVGESW